MLTHFRMKPGYVWFQIIKIDNMLCMFDFWKTASDMCRGFRKHPEYAALH